MTNISYTHIILSKKKWGLLGYVELFIIRVKFAIYYFLHFSIVRQVAARLRAKSAIYDRLVRPCVLASRNTVSTISWTIFDGFWPNLQHCRVLGRRWTIQIWGSKGQSSRSQWNKICWKQHFAWRAYSTRRLLSSQSFLQFHSLQFYCKVYLSIVKLTCD